MFTTFSWQVGFQRKANWHLRKLERLRALRRRLQFELPIPLTADAIVRLSNELSAMDLEMLKEQEEMLSELSAQKPPQVKG